MCVNNYNTVCIISLARSTQGIAGQPPRNQLQARRYKSQSPRNQLQARRYKSLRNQLQARRYKPPRNQLQIRRYEVFRYLHCYTLRVFARQATSRGSSAEASAYQPGPGLRLRVGLAEKKCDFTCLQSVLETTINSQNESTIN